MPQPKTVALMLALAGMFVSNVLMSGCRQKCYNCYEYSGIFSCYKGTDTISYEPFGSTDPSYYTAMGYTCDTLALLWEQVGGPGTQICYPPNKNANDSCALIQ